MKSNTKKMIIMLSIIAMLISIYPNRLKAEEEASIESIEDKLESITEEEKDILEYLFIQIQEIEELEREEKKILEEIDIIKNDIETLEERIKTEELSYDKYKVVLKEVLKTYQRMGPGSYIEIILSAENMSDLFNRINTLRDLTKGTSKLLEDLDLSRIKLESKKQTLDESLKSIETKQLILKEAIDKKALIIKAKEDYLISLAGNREYFLERLDNMNDVMGELKILISELSMEFSNLIENADFPEDAIKLTFSLSGMKGSIEENVFNKIISEHGGFPKMRFKFKPGMVELEIPEKKVFFTGNFIIVDGNSLKYDISEGSIYDLKLEKSSIDNLFSGGYFVMNLEPIIEKNTIKSIESMNGYIDLIIGIKLF